MCISGSDVPKEPTVQRKPSAATLDESEKNGEKRNAEIAVGAEPESEKKKMRGALGEAFSPSKAVVRPASVEHAKFGSIPALLCQMNCLAPCISE